MGLTITDVMGNAGQFFGAFNILGMGLVGLWIVGSIFLANAVTEKRDEKVLTMLVFNIFGGIIFFAKDPSKYLLLIACVLIVIYGMFKLLFERKTEEYR